MKAVIYARVSTDDQTTANQIPVLTGWANQLQLPGIMGPRENEPIEVIRVYSENESAWSAGHQAELARLIADAQRGQFKIVLVWALDRLTRQGIGAIFQLVHRLTSYGVRVYSYQEPWTLTPTSELYDLLLSLSGWVAAYESKRRSERTKAGLARKLKEGKKLGRPPGSRDKRKRARRRLVQP